MVQKLLIIINWLTRNWWQVLWSYDKGIYLYNPRKPNVQIAERIHDFATAYKMCKNLNHNI